MGNYVGFCILEKDAIILRSSHYPLLEAVGPIERGQPQDKQQLRSLHKRRETSLDPKR